eukprot:TRINITY_DN81570_c0_g1_i1.p1 TRINITY_DN81570_c0_g1~~TRINITY_DN81570_c0_g1_i1.p1  ORF type:complete len:866 (-),score=79.42 TRINITY_DN81570_c0_g1_i1:67-2634(-)
MNQFQGGQSFEVFSPQGSRPLSACVKLSNAKFIQKVFDRQLKGNVVNLEGDTTQTKLQLPKQDRVSLGLVQPVLVLQIFAYPGQPLYFECVVNDAMGAKRRLIFSTSRKDVLFDPLHVQLPLCGVPRDCWLNFCIDAPALFARHFKGNQLKSIDAIVIGPCCKLRKIFTLKTRLADQYVPGVDIPKHLDFPPGVEFTTLVLTGSDKDECVQRTASAPASAVSPSGEPTLRTGRRPLGHHATINSPPDTRPVTCSPTAPQATPDLAPRILQPRRDEMPMRVELPPTAPGTRQSMRYSSEKVEVIAASPSSGGQPTEPVITSNTHIVPAASPVRAALPTLDMSPSALSQRVETSVSGNRAFPPLPSPSQVTESVHRFPRPARGRNGEDLPAEVLALSQQAGLTAPAAAAVASPSSGLPRRSYEPKRYVGESETATEEHFKRPKPLDSIATASPVESLTMPQAHSPDVRHVSRTSNRQLSSVERALMDTRSGRAKQTKAEIQEQLMGSFQTLCPSETAARDDETFRCRESQQTRSPLMFAGVRTYDCDSTSGGEEDAGWDGDEEDLADLDSSQVVADDDMGEDTPIAVPLNWRDVGSQPNSAGQQLASQLSSHGLGIPVLTRSAASEEIMERLVASSSVAPGFGYAGDSVVSSHLMNLPGASNSTETTGHSHHSLAEHLPPPGDGHRVHGAQPHTVCGARSGDSRASGTGSTYISDTGLPTATSSGSQCPTLSMQTYATTPTPAPPPSLDGEGFDFVDSQTLYRAFDNSRSPIQPRAFRFAASTVSELPQSQANIRASNAMHHREKPTAASAPHLAAGRQSTVAHSEERSLLYDPALRCYYDPASNEYFEEVEDNGRN